MRYGIGSALAGGVCPASTGAETGHTASRRRWGRGAAAGRVVAVGGTAGAGLGSDRRPGPCRLAARGRSRSTRSVACSWPTASVWRRHRDGRRIPAPCARCRPCVPSASIVCVIAAFTASGPGCWEGWRSEAN